MRFWWREVAGWGLLLIGLLMFGACYLILLPNPGYPRIIEAGPLALIGIIVFRGGIHLLKVAVAARICTEAAAEPVKKGGPRG